MRNIIATIILTLAGMFFFLPACDDKEFLEEEPFDFLSPANFYQNESDALAALNSVYDGLQAGQSKWIAGGFSAAVQELGYLPTIVMNNSFGNDLDAWIWDSFEGRTGIVWNDSYTGISRANTVITEVPKIENIELGIQQRIVGEAQFLRALFYFILVGHFGNVPLVVEPTVGFDHPNFAPSNENTEAAVWQVIEEDLTAAEGVLPEAYPPQDFGRATKGAAQALLAKVYLQQKKWSEAAAKCEEIINSGVYQIDNVPFENNFQLGTESNPEIIFSVQYVNGGGGEGSMKGAWFGFNGGGGNQNVSQGGWILTVVEDSFFDSFDPNDPRRDITIVSEYIDANGRLVTYSPGDWSALPSRLMGKMITDDARTDGADFGLNSNVLRYADVLLMHSEAINMGGTSPGGMDAFFGINKVRARVGLSPLSGLGSEALRIAIAQERLWELSMESFGFMDLVRQDLAANMNLAMQFIGPLGAENAVAEKSFRYRLSIPQSALDQNPNLQQNPGY